MPFSWVYFLPKNSSRISILKKNSKAGYILLGNRPNFFTEGMTYSQNKPYCFKSGKIYISIGKITENVGKFQN